MLHDPLGLKFQPNRAVSACPTSLKRAEGCLAGLDLPTIQELLNLSPIAENFNTASVPLQLPSVSETLGWMPPEQQVVSCCSGSRSQEPQGTLLSSFDVVSEPNIRLDGMANMQLVDGLSGSPPIAPSQSNCCSNKNVGSVGIETCGISS